MIFSYILIYELVFHTTSGASQPGPPPTFKCRYRTACCNSVQNIPPQFLSLLSLQQFLVIEVSNNDSKGMWFSGSDARCFKSSAWFSRGQNFPYMCLPHFLGACIEVHIRKSIFEMTIFTSFLYINHISFLIPIYFHVFSISLIYQTRSDAQVLKVPAQALRIGCFPIARCGKCCKLGQERDGTRF